MNRREMVAGLTLPLLARAALAQPPTMPVIGILSAGAVESYAELMIGFREGLKETGYVEGRNVAIEARGADGDADLTAQRAAELMQRGVAVFVATGHGSALAARSASTAIPLVFLSQGDPVKFGLVASLNQRGGNATGVSVLAYDLIGKRLEIARQIAVASGPIGILVNPKGAGAEVQLKDVYDAARRLGQSIDILTASTPNEIDSAFASLASRRVGALVVSTDAFLFSQRRHVVALAERYVVPAIYDRREFATAGGLICYGTRYTDAFRQLGIYTGKILRGANPADLPVQQVATFELIISTKTAKALGLALPSRVVALSDEVIE